MINLSIRLTYKFKIPTFPNPLYSVVSADGSMSPSVLSTLYRACILIFYIHITLPFNIILHLSLIRPPCSTECINESFK